MPKVMAAIVQRAKRKTAGKRMTALVGKAQDDDDAFWTHDTWAEDDSGNDSFRDSDEDSELKKDEFDSDFNDSETDNEDEEAAAGVAEEQELQRQERSNRQRKGSSYVEIAKGGRALMQKAKGLRGKGPKRAMGDGMNTGLVLNFPPSFSAVAAAPGASTPLAPTSRPLFPAPPATGALPKADPTKPPSPRKPRKTLASVRERRSQTRKRESRNLAPTYTSTAANGHPHKKVKPQTGASTSRKAKRRQYAQEELILEAVHETEPENLRWLLARKRVQNSADQDKDALAALRDKNRGKNVIQKYHSRRGCLITLTFPEMDAVPEILTRPRTAPPTPEPLVCVITGKPAKYRDPKTKMGYFDSKAFKELRRRLAAGEPMSHRPKPRPQPTPSALPVPPASTTNASSKSSAGSSSQPTPVTVTSASAATAGTTIPNTKPKSKTSNGNRASSATPSTPKASSVAAAGGFMLDLGGAAKSPGSTRSSGRKWKPSEKMLQGRSGTTAKEAGTVPPSASSTKPQENPPPIPTFPDIQTKSPPAPLPPAAKAATANAKATENGKPTARPKAKATKKGASNGKPVTATKAKATVTKRVVGKAKAKQAANGASGKRKVTAKPAVSSKSSAASAGATESSKQNGAPTSSSEALYVIPPDSGSGIKEPQYVTQSELILKAITDYSRTHVDPSAPQGQAKPLGPTQSAKAVPVPVAPKTSVSKSPAAAVAPTKATPTPKTTAAQSNEIDSKKP